MTEVKESTDRSKTRKDFDVMEKIWMTDSPIHTLGMFKHILEVRVYFRGMEHSNIKNDVWKDGTNCDN
jgi:hypothetical protein